MGVEWVCLGGVVHVSLMSTKNSWHLCSLSNTAVFSLAYPRHVGPTSLQHRITFDMGMGITQKLYCGYRLHPHQPFFYALSYMWGEYCTAN